MTVCVCSIVIHYTARRKTLSHLHVLVQSRPLKSNMVLSTACLQLISSFTNVSQGEKQSNKKYHLTTSSNISPEPKMFIAYWCSVQQIFTLGTEVWFRAMDYVVVLWRKQKHVLRSRLLSGALECGQGVPFGAHDNVLLRGILYSSQCQHQRNATLCAERKDTGT